jgi:hypothetical protein
MRNFNLIMIIFLYHEFYVQSLQKLLFLSQKQNNYVVLSLVTFIKLLFLFCWWFIFLTCFIAIVYAVSNRKKICEWW